MSGKRAILPLTRPSGSRFSSSSRARSFDPNKIIPAEYKQVRILCNTVRDGQQSNLSAEMADEHRQQVSVFINDIYKPIQQFPGYEQIWGGTVPMFDIWKRGVHPFESLREMTARLPNTPTSALIRSNSLNSMGNLPKDVIDGFIRCAAESGVDVYTNFDAHNDWRNHKNVAEAIHKYGKHYQAAISWAVHHQDPTIYNVKWAVNFFRELAPLNPHSLYVKDPSGVLTPQTAGFLAQAIKEAFPDKPLVFHTHYQTGFGYMAYLKAVENGANGIECSLGLCDGAAQPFGLTLLRTLEEMGYDTGNPDKAAMQRVTDLSEELRKLYTVGRAVRIPDIRVEATGIAGGQRTILDKELRDAGQPHLISAIDSQVQLVRDEGGKVCQVTPVADSYAREAMRRLRGGDPARNFAPGYSAILIGEGGLVKEPVDEKKRDQALLDRVNAKARELWTQNAITKEVLDELLGTVIPQLREQMDGLAEATILRARIKEVSNRISELEQHSSNLELTANLSRKIAAAKAKDTKGRVILTIEDRIVSLKDELNDLHKKLKGAKPVEDESYEALLRQQGSDAQYKDILANNPHFAALVAAQKITLPIVKRLVASSGFVTCVAADLLAPGLPTAEQEIRALDKEFLIGLTTEGERTLREATVLQASFRQAAIPGLITNFFKNYRDAPDYWAPLFDGHDRSFKAKLKHKKINVKEVKPQKGAKDVIRREAHDRVAHVVGEDLEKMIQAATDIQELKEKLLRYEMLGDYIGKETKNEITKKIKEFEAVFETNRNHAKTKTQVILKNNPGYFSGQTFKTAGAAVPKMSEKEELAWVDALLQQLVQLSLQA